MKLQTSITLLIIIIVIVSVILMNGFFSKYITENTKDTITERMFTISRIVAQSDIVIDGLQNRKKQQAVQTYASELQEITDIGFLVVLDMNLIRLSHPLPEEIGKSFYDRNDAAPSLKGKEYASIEKGPLGLGMRVFTPIKNEQNKQIGVVVAGVSIDTVEEEIKKGQRIILLGAMFQLFIGVIGAYFISKYVKKVLFGMEPAEIARLMEERDIMLESVKEGIIVVNKLGIITRVNQQALTLMQFSNEADLIGKPVKDYLPVIFRTMQTGKSEENYEVHFYGKNMLLNCSPVYINNEIIGAIATFRDKTEIKKLLDEMSGIKNYTDALRAQSHEFKNKLHVILGMLHLKKFQELETIIPSMVGQYQMEVGYISQRIKHPALAGFLIGKMSKARENNISFEVHEESSLREEFAAPILHELITILGSLIENAFDAVMNNAREHKKVSLLLYSLSHYIHIEVTDNGAGVSDHQLENIMKKGYSTKDTNRGYGLYLTSQAVRQLDGNISITTKVGAGTTFYITLAIPMMGDQND